MKKVFIQGPGEWDFVRMFNDSKLGYKGTKNLDEAELVLFTGGEDINPALYFEKPLPGTFWNEDRDHSDKLVWKKALLAGKDMIGICRGGQFLNVMNGGRLWQHVGQHTIDHNVVDCITGEVIFVSSSHHQMMMPSTSIKNLAVRVAATNQAKYKRGDGCGWESVTDPKFGKKEILFDDEVLWYPSTKSLCFQPHPEYPGYHECTKYFFSLLDRYFSDKSVN